MVNRLAVVETHTDGTGERSAGQIIRDIVNDVQEVIRGEIRLAKAELTETARQAGRAAGMFGGAAVCGLFAGACFVVTCIAALALAMPVWLAALIMGICLASAGFAMFLGGRAQMRQVDPVPRRTVQTLKDDVEWAKHQTK